MNNYIAIENIDNEQRIVKKSNDLVRSYYDLSLTAMRIISMAISFIKDTDCRIVDIPLPTYKKLLNTSAVNYKHFDEVLKTLRQNTIVMAKVDKNSGEVTEGLITGWINRIYLKDNNVSLAFNEDVWEHIINLKNNFTQYYLSSVLDLTSKHACRLFEILKSYAWTGEYIVKVSELRNLLFLENKYKLYADLSKKIIEPAINEINNLQNKEIHVSYIPIKNGSRYDFIKFTIAKVNTEIENKNNDSIYPPEVLMAKNMSEIELFVSIKTLIMSKYRVVFSPNDIEWIDYTIYSKYAFESTYLSLLADEWKDHQITSPKAFFAEHLKRLTAK